MNIYKEPLIGWPVIVCIILVGILLHIGPYQTQLAIEALTYCDR